MKIIEEKEEPIEDFCDSDEIEQQPDPELTADEIRTQKECFDILRAMKGHVLKDGGKIAGFTITFTDKKTQKKTVVKI